MLCVWRIEIEREIWLHNNFIKSASKNWYTRLAQSIVDYGRKKGIAEFHSLRAEDHHCKIRRLASIKMLKRYIYKQDKYMLSGDDFQRASFRLESNNGKTNILQHFVHFVHFAGLLFFLTDSIPIK